MLSDLSDIYKRPLNKRFLNKQVKPVRRTPTNLKNAKWIGILFDASSPDATNTVLKYKRKLEQTGKKVNILGYVNSNSKELEMDFPFFTKRDINWKGVPQNEAIEEFLTRTFDIFLVLDTQPSLQSEYIATLTDARLKIGAHTKDEKCLDIMLEVDQKMELDRFIGAIEQYVSIIKCYNSKTIKNQSKSLEKV